MTATALGITLTGARKTFSAPKTAPVLALTPTSLSIHPGEFFSLVGPSGCGKSTLLNMVAGLLPATEGDIYLGDQRVDRPQRATGIVFQNATLLRWLTVYENVLLPARISKTLTPHTHELARQTLSLVGLLDARDRYPAELSGGMQQRVAIVRALVSDPQVLLMDEPFSALDEFTREVLQDELLALWRERPKTVLFITHNIGEAVYLSDRIGVMSAHPGNLEAVVKVPLPRPRSEATRSDPEFYATAAKLRAMLDAGRGSLSDPSTVVLEGTP